MANDRYEPPQRWWLEPVEVGGKMVPHHMREQAEWDLGEAVVTRSLEHQRHPVEFPNLITRLTEGENRLSNPDIVRDVVLHFIEQGRITFEDGGRGLSTSKITGILPPEPPQIQ